MPAVRDPARKSQANFNFQINICWDNLPEKTLNLYTGWGTLSLCSATKYTLNALFHGTTYYNRHWPRPGFVGYEQGFTFTVDKVAQRTLSLKISLFPPSLCSSEVSEEMNLVLPEAFPENILSIISQQNTDCANVMLTTFFSISKKITSSLFQISRNQN